MPVFHVNTDNSAPIDSKEVYVDAKYWLDTSCDSSLSPFGSAQSPLALGIRGRGNASWTNFDKKPYKLKLDKKQPVLGMPKNKHFALLTNIAPSCAYFSDYLIFEVGRRLGMKWCPAIEPVELVLNGNNVGLYFAYETVRVDPWRVDIGEQPVGNTDTATIAGGYLAEIDNYRDTNQITIQENDQYNILITFDTPDPLDSVQTAYLTREFTAINQAIYDPDKTSRRWEEYVDLNSLARYFVVQEIANNQDAFSGSVKIAKDTVAGAKWEFVTLWDTGLNAHEWKNGFTFQVAHKKTWIPELVKFPRFMKAVQEVWAEFKRQGTDWIDPWVTDFYEKIDSAESVNQRVWPQYNTDYPLWERLARMLRMVRQHIEWLDDQWAEPLTAHLSVNADKGTVLVNGHDFADGYDLFADSVFTLSFEADRPNPRVIFDGQELSDRIADHALRLKMPDHDCELRVEYAESGLLSPSEDTSGRTAVYNLQGIPVSTDRLKNPAPLSGVYIIVEGGRASKVRR